MSFLTLVPKDKIRSNMLILMSHEIYNLMLGLNIQGTSTYIV